MLCRTCRILGLIGITAAGPVAGLNGGLAIMNLFIAAAAGTQVERFGRRFFWLAGVAGMLAAFSVVT